MVARSEAERAGPEGAKSDDHPESRTQAPKCGKARSLFLKGRAHPAGACQVFAAPIRTTPVLKQKKRLLAPVLRQSAFSFDRERPFSFRRNRKENGGSFPRRKAAQSPVPAPWAGHPVPARRRTLSASLKEKQGPCPCAAQRHIVPRLTARRHCPYPHLLHF